MNADDERLIERFLRRPEALSEADRRAARQLMEDDPAADAYADVLRTFYERLDEEKQRDPDPRVDAFVDSLFEKEEVDAVLSLHPYCLGDAPRSTVMAAATTAASEDRRFSVLTTLASDDEQVLVRVIGDREAGRGRLYVLADPPLQQAHVIVSFPELGLVLVTDADGRRAFDLPTGIEAEQWEEAQAVVRRPVATRRLKPSAAAVLQHAPDGRVECRREDDGLTATVHTADNASAPSLLMVETDEEDRVLLRLDEREPVQHALRTAEEVILRLYE